MAASLLPCAAHAFGKYDARNGEECRAQVNANYDAVVAEMRAHGNLRGIEVTNRRSRAPDLAECDQMDRQAREAVMVKAHQRLSAAIDDLKAHRPLPADQRLAVETDHEAILKFPPAPYREACMRLYADYLRLQSPNAPPPAASAPASSPATDSAGSGTRVYRCTGANGQVGFSQRPCASGQAQAPVTVQPVKVGTSASQAQCDAIQARTDTAKKSFDDAEAALAAQRTSAPRDTNGKEPDWKALRERRQAALSEWQWQQDRARAAGCVAR